MGSTLKTTNRARLLALAVTIAALAVAAPLVLRSERSAGALDLHACAINGVLARCGGFGVAENPNQPGGRRIRLAVAVIPATGAHPKPDPVMWLSGWGGAGASDDSVSAAAALRRVNIDRDLIFVDQRGTGTSKLTCPLPTAWMRVHPPVAAITATARRCAVRIGPNLRYYTSSVAVDDFDRLRQALGYRRVNLYGGSYGVTTGQIYLLRHGQSVRSAVFDSGSLLDVHIFERGAAGGQRALELLFRRCAHDTGCSTAYPDLRGEFRRVMARLAAHPIQVSGTRMSLTPLTFAAAVGDAVAYSSGKAEAPRLIDLIARGRIRAAAALFRSAIGSDQRHDLAYQLLIQCSEPWASWRPRVVQRLGAGSYLEPVDLMHARVYSAVCKAFPRGVAPAAIGRRVQSRVPILFLTGNEDPADPPANVAGARRELPKSRTVVFPNAGHGQLGLLCAQNLTADFIARGGAGSLDSSCAATAVRSEFDIRR